MASSQGRIQVLVWWQTLQGTLAGYTASKFTAMGLCQPRNGGWEQGVTAICLVNTDMASAVQSCS